ncbi:MAG: chorismate mutase [Phycisphaerae bacterium]|nr:chorismate mutase [Phycisphaerae bacterium]
MNDQHNPHEPNDPAVPAESLDLETLRRRIDQVDETLVGALAERARIVQDIGRFKQGEGSPIYAPDRESRVLQRVLQLNDGPLPDTTIEAIYRELMSGSFMLEKPLQIAYLGPPGTISHTAALRHFGHSVEFCDMQQIDDVFKSVASGQCSYGYVPYENSIDGGITDTLDALQEHQVQVYSEALIEVKQCLLSNWPLEQIRRVCSKPQALNQCRRWLAANLPHAEIVPAASTAAAVITASKEEGTAAVGAVLAGEIYHVNVLLDSIQDKANNITRFLVISREHARPSGDDKTSLMFVTGHKPGSLVDVLAAFRDNQINLSHIDKRPSGRTNWEYTFFIDCDVHQDDPRMVNAIERASEHCVLIKVLGSYPRATRIL